MVSAGLKCVRTASIAFLTAWLAACGGGGSGAGQQASSGPPSNGNSAPTINGAPGTGVVAGEAYTFQPSASDADSDPLTFAVTNLPGWATFDAATGRLSGTPTSADIATYADIRITVSDGRGGTGSLAPFSIAVTAMGTGVATLSWTPPTQNSDGSALTDLTGYEVRYGRTADDLSRMVPLDNPSLSSYVIENLSNGTWYFAVSAVNSRGVPSPLSNVASKVIG